MVKNIQELPLELLIKFVKNNNTFNNNMFLRMTSKKIKEQMDNIDKDMFDKLLVLWIKNEKLILRDSIWDLQLDNAKEARNLSQKQLKVNKTFRISQYQHYQQEQYDAIQQLLSDKMSYKIPDDKRDAIQKLLCDHTDSIQKLLCDQTKTLLENSTEQIEALWKFNT